MREAIIQKLNYHLAGGMKQEADVVYFMTEVRKLFEHEASAAKYPALSFYANWCLHTKIDRQSFADHFLDVLDKALIHYETDKNAGAFFLLLSSESLFTIFGVN